MLIWIFTFLLGGGSSAQAQVSTERVELSKPSVKTRIDGFHSRVSARILSTATKIDNILGLDSAIEQTNKSYFRITTLSTGSRFEAVKFKTKISTKLSLPKTESRLQFFVYNTSDEKREDSIKTPQKNLENSSPQAEKSIESSNFVAGIRNVFLQNPQYHFHADTGVKFKVPVDPYVRARARESLDPPGFGIHFTQHAYAYIQSGMGFDFGVAFDKPVNQILYFHQPNLASYHEDRPYFELQNGLNLVHSLSKGRSLIYFTNVIGATKPVIRSTSYNWGVTFRIPIQGWSWVFLEFTPIISHPRQYNFAADPGVTFKLQATFGS